MVFRVILLLILLAFRFYHLDARPPHHDEAVNGWFVDGILNRGYYVYDPQNYHGPLFFYILTFFTKIFGRSIEVLRYPTVIFGSLVTFTPFLFKKWLGKSGAWIAAVFLALSPAMIFYSRYCIHETLFMLSCILFFYYWLQVKEQGFIQKNILGFGLSLGAMACLKENFVLYGASLVIAEALIWFYDKKKPFPLNRDFWKGLGLSVLLAVIMIVICFTGLFQDLDGIPHFFKAFLLWFETGEKGNGHSKPFEYWLTLMAHYEWLALFGLLMIPFAIKKVSQELRLTCVVSFGLWLLYSVVSYKTPWCVLSYEWGLVLVGSYWLGRWYDSGNQPFVILALLTGLSVSSYQAYDVAYDQPDQEGHLFIYGQTYRDFMLPLNQIVDRAKANPELYSSLRIQVVSAFTWPLPYVLGKFTSTGYFGDANAPSVLNGDYVIMDQNFEEKMSSRLTGNYKRTQVRSRQWALPAVIFEKISDQK